MAGEMDRYRPARYQEPPNQQGQQYNPLDPRRDSYEMGMELAQRGGQVARPDDAFSNPFFTGGFEQGQTKRQTTHRRSVHVINENEYILTEETVEMDVFSFGNNIFQDWRRNRQRRDKKEGK